MTSTKQHIKVVAYHLQNAKNCLIDALDSVEKTENKQHIQSTYNIIDGALQDAIATLSSYKD